jgi:uncharacterized protein YrrD
VTSAGKKVGKVERVVIDPQSNELTHLVVEKGFLFTQDKVIPFDFVDSAAHDRVVLKESGQDPDDFPDFEETHYVRVEDERTSEEYGSKGLNPLAWYYPVPGSAWWRARNFIYPGIPKSPYVRKTELNIPEGTVPLEEGVKVVSSTGERVGDVERIYVDDDEQRVTHLLISKGLLSKSHKLIPSMWVVGVAEGAIRLSVDQRLVESLPEFASRD